jgi:signal transduction histidine kinase
VGTTAEGFRPFADGSGVRLVVHLPADRAFAVMVDPDRLAQILANLVENALAFARTTVTVSLSASDPSAPSGTQIITVEDDGPGIATGDLTRVFDRFYQADHGPNRQFGSGLGLAIVAELAAAMGATVRAVSPINVEGGSRFELTMGGAEPLRA